MLGLGEYGSSDEEDKSAQVSAVSVSSKGSSKKKMKRVMGLSAVLPPEIRQLLESGGGGDDEDEEDNWSASKSAAARREARATVAPVSNEIKQQQRQAEQERTLQLAKTGQAFQFKSRSQSRRWS
jgi:hypothetical protein